MRKTSFVRTSREELAYPLKTKRGYIVTFHNRKRTLAAKIETTPGTAESLSARRSVQHFQRRYYPRYPARDPRSGRESPEYLASLPGGYKGSANFASIASGTVRRPSPLWADTFLPVWWLRQVDEHTFNPLNEAPGCVVKTCWLIGLWRETVFLSLCRDGQRGR